MLAMPNPDFILSHPALLSSGAPGAARTPPGHAHKKKIMAAWASAVRCGGLIMSLMTMTPYGWG